MKNVHTKTCTWMFLEALFKISKKGKEFKCLSTAEQINRLWNSHPPPGNKKEWNINTGNMNESQKHLAKWIKSKQMTTYCLSPFTWNFRKGEVIVTENRSVATWGKGRWKDRHNGCSGKVFMVMETSVSCVWSCFQEYMQSLKFYQTLHLKWVSFIVQNHTWLQCAEQKWVLGDQQEANVPLVPHLSHSTPFPMALQLGSLTQQGWGTWFFSSSLQHKGSNHHHCSGHHLRVWLVPKDITGLTEILPTKQPRFCGDQHPLSRRRLTAHTPQLVFSRPLSSCQQRERLNSTASEIPLSPTACDFKYNADVIWAFISNLPMCAPRLESPPILSPWLPLTQPSWPADVPFVLQEAPADYSPASDCYSRYWIISQLHMVQCKPLWTVILYII